MSFLFSHINCLYSVNSLYAHLFAWSIKYRVQYSIGLALNKHIQSSTSMTEMVKHDVLKSAEFSFTETICRLCLFVSGQSLLLTLMAKIPWYCKYGLFSIYKIQFNFLFHFKVICKEYGHKAVLKNSKPSTLLSSLLATAANKNISLRWNTEETLRESRLNIYSI